MGFAVQLITSLRIITETRRPTLNLVETLEACPGEDPSDIHSQRRKVIS